MRISFDRLVPIPGLPTSRDVFYLYQEKTILQVPNKKGPTDRAYLEQREGIEYMPIGMRRWNDRFNNQYLYNFIISLFLIQLMSMYYLLFIAWVWSRRNHTRSTYFLLEWCFSKDNF